MIRTWIGYDREKAMIVDVMEYEGDDFDRIPGATYVEIFPPLHPGAIKLEKSTNGTISIVRDDDKWSKLEPKLFRNFRQERNRRLAEVDWIFSSDYQVEDTLYKEWLAYRKALRDLPSLTEDPANPTWPEKPETPTGKTEGIQTPHFVATLMTENSQLRSKVTALERKSTKFELDIIDMKRRIQRVET